MTAAERNSVLPAVTRSTAVKRGQEAEVERLALKFQYMYLSLSHIENTYQIRVKDFSKIIII